MLNEGKYCYPSIKSDEEKHENLRSLRWEFIVFFPRLCGSIAMEGEKECPKGKRRYVKSWTANKNGEG